MERIVYSPLLTELPVHSSLNLNFIFNFSLFQRTTAIEDSETRLLDFSAWLRLPEYSLDCDKYVKLPESMRRRVQERHHSPRRQTNQNYGHSFEIVGF